LKVHTPILKDKIKDQKLIFGIFWSSNGKIGFSYGYFDMDAIARE